MSIDLKICLAQTRPSPDPQENLETAEHLLKTASASGCDLVVFPEMFMAYPEQGQPSLQLAEPADGAFTQELARLAREYSTAIVCGIWETVSNAPDKVANVAIALDADGELVSRYTKIHLFDALGHRESATMQAGSEVPQLFSIKGISCGLAICYDLRFPELFRDQALRGADVLLIPAAWYAGPLKEEQWQTLLRARAIENTVYTVGVTFCGSPFCGRSAAFDPFGAVMADLGVTEKIAVIDIDRAYIDDVRRKMPSLSHVRRDIL